MAIVSCILLIGVLLFIVAGLPLYGQENVRADEVIAVISKAVLRKPSVNIVSGYDPGITDTFDTLSANPRPLYGACLRDDPFGGDKNMRPD